jgi:hypothetical protein
MTTRAGVYTNGLIIIGTLNYCPTRLCRDQLRAMPRKVDI